MAKANTFKKSETGSASAMSECFRALAEAEAKCGELEVARSEVEFQAVLSSVNPIMTSPRPLKRRRDSDVSESSSSSDAKPGSQSFLDSSKPVHETSPSPSKRQKREGDDTTPEPPLAVQKKVRFHPATADNSLWAELYRGKYHSEDQAYTDDETIQDDFPVPAEPTSRLLKRPYLSRREVSTKKAEAFLERESWKNDFVFIDRTSDDESDSEDETLSSHFDDDEAWPKEDLDDVSVPRSSPSPFLRDNAFSAAAANRLQDAHIVAKQREAQAEPPSIYARPVQILVQTPPGGLSYKPINVPRSLRPPGPAPTQDDVSQQADILNNILDKLPAELKVATWQALKTITVYRAREQFDEGFRAGMQVGILRTASLRQAENSPTK